MVSLNTISYTPQDEEYIKATDLSNLVSKIQANFVVINNALTSITDDNIFTGDNVFNGETTFNESVDFTGNISINGTTITANADEINILDGVTADKNEINILDGVTADKNEINFLDTAIGGTQKANKAVIADSNVNIGITKVTELYMGSSGSEIKINATATEINNSTDISAFSQTLTVSGAVTAGKKEILLDHTSVAIAATIADTSSHRGGLLVKAITEPGAGQDHTVTITTGTWNGTNKVATFSDINDAIYVIFDSAGNGSVIGNVGSVSFSG